MNNENFKGMYEENLINQNKVYDNVIDKINNKSKKKRFHFILKPIVAVSLAIILFLGGFSVYSISTEIREYKTAISFFQEYNLPTEGLSRSDIKAVYKDITLKTFSFEKTLEILNSFSIELYSMELGTRDREELEALWNYRNLILSNPERQINGIHYKITESNEVIVIGGLTKSIINKFDGKDLLWSKTIEYCLSGIMSDFIETQEGVVLSATALERTSQRSFGIVIMFDKTGNIIWEKYATELNSQFTVGILDNNHIIVFGHRFSDTGGNRQWHFMFKKYDLQGNLIQTKEKLLNEYQMVSTAVLVNDYYLVKCFSHTNSNQLMSISREGEFIANISYSDNGNEYIIQDIYAHNGKIYLSALLSNIDTAVFNEEFANLLSEYYEAFGQNFTSMPESYNKRLRDLFIKQYSAVLLVCDESGAIRIAYSVTNARGGLFSLSTDNLLQWQVIRIDDVKNAHPAISSRVVDITATDFRFVFMDETLVKKIEVGLLFLFR